MSELRNEFAYSWSRAQMFYHCPRQFYWQYYGSWGGWYDDAPATSQLAYMLKYIKSVAMLIGDVFHKTIRQALHKRPERPCGVPVEDLRAGARTEMIEQFAASHAKRWRSNPKYHANLFEDYYGGGVAPEESREALEVVDECIEGFAGSGFGKRAFGVDKSSIRLIDPDDIESMRVTVDGLLVYAPPDLVVDGKADSALHIVDWKTGKPRRASLAQLAIYGLLVSEKYRVPMADVTAHLVYVRQGAHEPYPDLASGIEEAKRGITTFVNDVRERLTDIALNQALDIDRFPMTSDLWKCRSCKFRELCGRTGEPALAPSEEFVAD